MDLQTEYGQLQREYRNMEQNRRSYAEESQGTIRRLQDGISKLQGENDSLKHELALETRQTQTTASGMNRLSVIQDEGDRYTRSISAEKVTYEQLGAQIKLLNSKLDAQRRNMGGVHAAKETQQMISKQIRILENRLDKALVKFNEALATNKKLRLNIDSLRRERVVFDNIYRKLEVELKEKKKQMANIIESSNGAYEARDAAQLEMAAKNAQNKKEAEEFARQMSELSTILDSEKRKREVALMSGATSHRGGLSTDEEDVLRTKAKKEVWNVAKEKVKVANAAEKVHTFEEAFNRIKAATGITDIDELVSTFISNEDQNFSLYQFLNEQNNEIEKLQEAVDALREDEAKYSEDNDNVNQHQALVKEIEGKLFRVESQASNFEVKHHELSKTFNALKVGIQSIFQKLRPEAAGSEILSDGNVTDTNMMQYLGVIEQSVNELLQKYATVKSKEGRAAEVNVPGVQPSPGRRIGTSAMDILGSGPNVPSGHEQVSIKAPTLDEFDSEDESDGENEHDTLPLTRDELKQKTLKGLAARERMQGQSKRQPSSRQQGASAPAGMRKTLR